MRSALLVNAFKRLGVQGFGRSVCQQRSPYDESRVVFSLFFKTFSSAESASVENTEEPLKESRSKSLSRGLYRKVSDNSSDSAESVLEKWVNDGKKLEKYDLQGLVRGLRRFRKYKKALEVSAVLEISKDRFDILIKEGALIIFKEDIQSAHHWEADQGKVNEEEMRRLKDYNQEHNIDIDAENQRIREENLRAENRWEDAAEVTAAVDPPIGTFEVDRADYSNSALGEGN